MFSMSWTSPYEGEVKAITFSSPDGKKNNPFWRGLGHYKDIYGVMWDVYAIMGGRINARRISHHPNYYSTGQWLSAQDTDLVQSWEPYDVKLVKEGTCKRCGSSVFNEKLVPDLCARCERE